MSVGITTISHNEAALIEVVGALIRAVSAENPVVAERLHANLRGMVDRATIGKNEQDNGRLVVLQALRRIAPSAIPDTSGE